MHCLTVLLEKKNIYIYVCEWVCVCVQTPLEEGASKLNSGDHGGEG